MFQHNTPLKALTDISRRLQRRRRVICVTDDEHGMLCFSAKVSRVPLLGLEFPLGSEHSKRDTSLSHEGTLITQSGDGGQHLIKGMFPGFLVRTMDPVNSFVYVRTSVWWIQRSLNSEELCQISGEQ